MENSEESNRLISGAAARVRARLKSERDAKCRRLKAMTSAADHDDPAEFQHLLVELANANQGREAFLRLRRYGRLPPKLRDVFAKIWVENGDIWRSEVNDDLLFIDVFRSVLLPYGGPPRKLYRGDSSFNRRRRTYGMSWSTNLD